SRLSRVNPWFPRVPPPFWSGAFLAVWLRRDEPGCADRDSRATAADMYGCGPLLPVASPPLQVVMPRTRLDLQQLMPRRGSAGQSPAPPTCKSLLCLPARESRPVCERFPDQAALARDFPDPSACVALLFELVGPALGIAEVTAEYAQGAT